MLIPFISIILTALYRAIINQVHICSILLQNMQDFELIFAGSGKDLDFNIEII